MPIPLFGKLISGTGNPYADADQVEVDATGFDGNLETTDVNMQMVAQKLDDLTVSGGDGFTGVTSSLITGDILQTTYTSPAPASPITTNVDLSSLVGGTGTVDVQGTPTANQIATWVDSDTLQGVNSIPIGSVQFATGTLAAGSVANTDTQALYESRRNTAITTTVTSSVATVLRLPVLSSRPDWYRTGDLFIYGNSASSTRSVTLQAGNAGDRIAGADTQDGLSITIQPGQQVIAQLPSRGRTWTRVYVGPQLVSGGAAGSMGEIDVTSPLTRVDPWFYNENNAIATYGNTVIERDYDTTNSNVRLSLTASAGSPNISGTFGTDRGMIAWFGDILPNVTDLDLGSDPTSISAQENVDSAKTWLSANIVNGYDFTTVDKETKVNITSSFHTSGNTVRFAFSSGTFTTTQTTGRTIRITGMSDSRLNGDFPVTLIQSAHFEVTVAAVSDNSADETGVTGASGSLVWFGEFNTSVNIAGRVAAFYLFTDSAKTIAALPATNYFDHTYDPSDPGNTGQNGWDVDYLLPDRPDSALAVGGEINTMDSDGTSYSVARGSINKVHYIDNVTSATFRHYIPLSAAYTYIRTNTTIEIYLDIDTASMDEGEVRVFNVAVDEGVSPYTGAGYYAIAVGSEGNIGTFDNGLTVAYIYPGGHISLLAYNNGATNGVRILTPTKRTRDFIPAYQVDTTLTLALSDRLPIAYGNRDPATDEDPSGWLIGLDNASGVPANTVRLKADVEYTFKYNLTLKFNGAEGTGLLFVPATLVPYSGSTALSRHAATGTLLFSRNGQTGSSAPKFELTLSSEFRHVGSNNEDIHWRLLFGSFPAGYSISDIQIYYAGGEATAEINLK